MKDSNVVSLVEAFVVSVLELRVQLTLLERELDELKGRHVCTECRLDNLEEDLAEWDDEEEDWEKQFDDLDDEVAVPGSAGAPRNSTATYDWFDKFGGRE